MISSKIFRSERNLIENNYDTDFEEESRFSGAFKKIVCILVLFAAISSFVSYTLVLSKEKELQLLHSKTVSKEMDNIYMRNNVEFTKSLYNVNKKAKSVNYLQKPLKIIEIDLDEKKLSIDLDKTLQYSNDRIVAGY